MFLCSRDPSCRCVSRNWTIVLGKLHRTARKYQHLPAFEQFAVRPGSCPKLAGIVALRNGLPSHSCKRDMAASFAVKSSRSDVALAACHAPSKVARTRPGRAAERGEARHIRDCGAWVNANPRRLSKRGAGQGSRRFWD